MVKELVEYHFFFAFEVERLCQKRKKNTLIVEAYSCQAAASKLQLTVTTRAQAGSASFSDGFTPQKAHPGVLQQSVHCCGS